MQRKSQISAVLTVFSLLASALALAGVLLRFLPDPLLIVLLAAGFFFCLPYLFLHFHFTLAGSDSVRKINEERLRNLERYETAVQKCGCTIFEYSPDSGCACCLSGPDEIFGCGPEESFSKAMVEHGDVHPEETERFLAFFEKVGAGAQTAQGDFRLRQGNHPYYWYRIRICAVADENGGPKKAIGRISDITFQKQEVQKLLNRAQRDELTGLLNRAAASRLIENALSENESCALMMIDIDRFKEINDTMGHICGDTVLAEVGAELKKLFRATDLVGRLGGDEFTVLLRNVSDRNAIAEKAQEVQNSLSGIFFGENKARHLHCSIGIARFPEDGGCFSELYARADEALYRCKRSGRNRYSFHEIVPAHTVGAASHAEHEA